MDEPIDTIVSKAINRFLKLKNQTLSIQTALATSTLPPKLISYIKEAFTKEAEGQFLKRKQELIQQTPLLSSDNLSKRKVKLEDELINLKRKIIFSNETLDQLRIDYITMPNQQMPSYTSDECMQYIQQTDDEYKPDLLKLHVRIFQDGDTSYASQLILKVAKALEISECKIRIRHLTEQIKPLNKYLDQTNKEILEKQLVIVSNSHEFTTQLNAVQAQISQKFEFDSLPKDSLFKSFVTALRTQIRNRAELNKALEDYDSAQLIYGKQVNAIVRILDDKLLTVTNQDKANRISGLKQQLLKFPINSRTTSMGIESIITAWWQQNDALFHQAKTSCCCFFPRRPLNPGQFIEQCLDVVRASGENVVVTPDFTKDKTLSPWAQISMI